MNDCVISVLSFPLLLRPLWELCLEQKGYRWAWTKTKHYSVYRSYCWLVSLLSHHFCVVRIVLSLHVVETCVVRIAQQKADMMCSLRLPHSASPLPMSKIMSFFWRIFFVFQSPSEIMIQNFSLLLKGMAARLTFGYVTYTSSIRVSPLLALDLSRESWSENKVRVKFPADFFVRVDWSPLEKMCFSLYSLLS